MSILVLRSSAGSPAPPDEQDVGALATPGGNSGANSGALRISRAGNSVNVGNGDFTIEWWVRPSATAGDNPRTGVSAGANYSGTDGNIILDSHSEVSGQFIAGLTTGRLYLSVNFVGTGNEQTIVGTTDLRDGAWHHCFIYRDSATGLMQIGVDGDREASATGPTGDLSYPGGGDTRDSAHIFCKEKFEAGGAGFDGDISEIRFSTNQRYSGSTYVVPTAPFETDGETVGLYHLDENTGTTFADSSGDGNNGTLMGSPVPTWLTADPFGGT